MLRRLRRVHRSLCSLQTNSATGNISVQYIRSTSWFSTEHPHERTQHAACICWMTVAELSIPQWFCTGGPADQVVNTQTRHNTTCLRLPKDCRPGWWWKESGGSGLIGRPSWQSRQVVSGIYTSACPLVSNRALEPTRGRCFHSASRTRGEHPDAHLRTSTSMNTAFTCEVKAQQLAD